MRFGRDGERRTTGYTYGPHGQLSRLDGPRSDVADTTEFVYDSQGRLIETRNALGHSTVSDQLTPS